MDIAFTIPVDPELEVNDPITVEPLEHDDLRLTQGEVSIDLDQAATEKLHRALGYILVERAYARGRSTEPHILQTALYQQPASRRVDRRGTSPVSVPHDRACRRGRRGVQRGEEVGTRAPRLAGGARNIRSPRGRAGGCHHRYGSRRDGLQINLSLWVPHKFNLTSDKVGLKTRL
jgi:hypothetical protein